MKPIAIALTSALATLALLEQEALAIGQFRDTIPASACQIENANDIGKADLVDGSWQIAAGIQNDTVELLCPVRISHFFVLGNVKTTLLWSHIEMFYRDPDGNSANHSVTATLFRVTVPTPPVLLDTFTSGAILTTDVKQDKQLAVFGVPLLDSQHFIRIQMKQGAGAAAPRVRFTRVRLFDKPPAIEPAPPNP